MSSDFNGCNFIVQLSFYSNDLQINSVTLKYYMTTLATYFIYNTYVWITVVIEYLPGSESSLYARFNPVRVQTVGEIKLHFIFDRVIWRMQCIIVSKFTHVSIHDATAIRLAINRFDCYNNIL